MTGTGTAAKLAGTFPRGVFGSMMTSCLPAADCGVRGVIDVLNTSTCNPIPMSVAVMLVSGIGAGSVPMTKSTDPPLLPSGVDDASSGVAPSFPAATSPPGPSAEPASSTVESDWGPPASVGLVAESGAEDSLAVLASLPVDEGADASVKAPPPAFEEHPPSPPPVAAKAIVKWRGILRSIVIEPIVPRACAHGQPTALFRVRNAQGLPEDRGVLPRMVAP
jgi:hypothetical protein